MDRIEIWCQTILLVIITIIIMGIIIILIFSPWCKTKKDYFNCVRNVIEWCALHAVSSVQSVIMLFAPSLSVLLLCMDNMRILFYAVSALIVNDENINKGANLI